MPNGNSIWPTWASNRLFALLLTILFAYAIVWLGTLVRLNTLKAERVGRADVEPFTILIDGTGKVTGKPDIATVTLGLTTKTPDVTSAQRENTEKMNAFIEELKNLAIPDDDIQTVNYSIFPERRYEPTTRQSNIVGYNVSQNLQVKIRDLAKISTVLGKAGEAGLNQVSGINFTIDDPEALRSEARAKALRQAKDKAEAMARELGVRLGRVVAFSESGGVPPPYPFYGRTSGLEFGGAAEVPQIESGSLDVQVTVQVTYEIE